MKLGIILLAGGKGSRMGSTIPKQFLNLAGRSIASYSFDLLKPLGRMVVVVDDGWSDQFEGVTIASPGKERQDSVWNGLQKLEDVDYVLVHDAARPLVEMDAIDRLITAVEIKGAVALGVPVKPTIKIVRDGTVISTPNRALLWEVQTPQIVRYEWLLEGLTKARREGLTVTDDLSVAELLGHETHLIKGDYKNLKITTPEDLIFAESILLNPAAC